MRKPACIHFRKSDGWSPGMMVKCESHPIYKYRRIFRLKDWGIGMDQLLIESLDGEVYLGQHMEFTLVSDALVLGDFL